jgi:DNA (cytosine-5)-methyltransferase 1
VDVLWLSFPCQAFSTAGKRLGAADERNGWPWTVAALDRFRPTWLLGENVRGLLLHTGGCTFAGGQEGLFSRPDPSGCPGCYFERVILPDLRARFAHVGWWLLDAADYGVPQHRRRVILWAGPHPLTEPAPTHGPGRALPWVSMGEALGLGQGIAEYGSGRSGRIAYESIPLDGPANAVGCGGTCGVALVTEWVPWLARPSPTVSAVGEQKGSGPGGNPEKMQRASDALYLATGRRRLTHAEVAVLQAFPSDHPFQGGSGAQYRQIGNAVPPRLAEVVGRALLEAAR